MKTHRETARATWWRRLLPAARLAIVAAGLTAASCGKTNNYAYVDVSVYVDPNSVSKIDFLDPANIVSCEMYVTGAANDPAVPLLCMPTSDSYPSVGTFEWDTTVGKGDVQFTVTLYALNRVPYAMGTSAPITIKSGQKQTANMVVTLVPAGGMTGTGGAGGSAGTGGVSGTGGSPGGGGSGGSAGGSGGTAGASGSGGAGGSPGTGGAAGRGGAGGGAGVGGSSSGGVGGAGTAGAGGDSAGGAGGS